MIKANYLPRADYLAIKAATRALQRLCGTQEQCAAITRIDQQHISNCISPDDKWANTYLPLDAVIDLEAESGQPIVTREMARLAGYELVPIEAGPPQASLQMEFIHLSKETADMLSHAAAIAADADPGEALLAQALAEAREARIASQRMEAGIQARLDEVRARGLRR